MAHVQIATGSSRPAPALRLIKTTEINRDQWLEVRRSGIGSSDAAAAVGLNPYKSQLELWMEKTGRGAALPQVDPNDESSPMYWGTLLEPIVAAHYTKRTGNRVPDGHPKLLHCWPVKLLQAGRGDYAGSEVMIRRAAASLSL